MLSVIMPSVIMLIVVEPFHQTVFLLLFRLSLVSYCVCHIIALQPTVEELSLWLRKYKMFWLEGALINTKKYCWVEKAYQLSTVDLLIKIACFVKKENNIFDIKRI
jgi:hypothetical protein